MNFNRNTGLLLALGALMVVSAPRAFANAELILSDGIAADTQTVSATCTVAGCVASYNGAVGNWNINVTTGTSAPGQSPELDLNSIDHFNGGSTGQVLTLTWSATGFTPLSPGYELNAGGTIGAHGTITAGLYGANSNTLLDQSQQVGSTLSFSNPPIAFSGSQIDYPPVTVNPYSLTEIATITFGSSAGQASFDYSVDSVPEPAGVLLFGTLALFTVISLRRKAAAKRA